MNAPLDSSRVERLEALVAWGANNSVKMFDESELRFLVDDVTEVLRVLKDVRDAVAEYVETAEQIVGPRMGEIVGVHVTTRPTDVEAARYFTARRNVNAIAGVR